MPESGLGRTEADQEFVAAFTWERDAEDEVAVEPPTAAAGDRFVARPLSPRTLYLHLLCVSLRHELAAPSVAIG